MDVSKATLNLTHSAQSSGAVDVDVDEVDVLRSPSLIVLMVSADVKQLTLKKSLPPPASVITAEVDHESYVCPARTVSHTRTMYTLSVLSHSSGAV